MLNRRKPLRRLKLLDSHSTLKRTPFRSKKHKPPLDPGIRQAVLARDQFTCQAFVRGFPHRCGGSLHVHHVRLRKQGGSDDPANLLTVCLIAHDLIHNTHRAMAEEYGLIRRHQAEPPLGG